MAPMRREAPRVTYHFLSNEKKPGWLFDIGDYTNYPTI